MISSSSSKFELLPTRPPTPPREISKAVNDAIAFLDDSNEVDRLLSRPTSSHRASSKQEETSPTLARTSESVASSSRRVGFSSNPTYCATPDPENESTSDDRSHTGPVSSKNPKPIRSILKRANSTTPLTPDDLESKLSYFSPQIPGSFAKMLQSVCQQLAGTSRSARLDAYMNLNGVLQTYEGIPETAAMTQKMSLLTQFLSRDMAWKDSEGKHDVNIINQALKLTISILSNSKLAESLDEDFKTFLLDRSIIVIEKDDMPKAIIKIHLFLLAQQRFQSSMLANGKADRILSALNTIEDRCSGNSAIATRLVVYQRLFEQAPSVMLGRIREWLEHVFHGMLSSVKDVQTRAIETCTQAGRVFGAQSYAAKSLHELLDCEVEEGTTYCDYLISRLEDMLRSKEDGVYVPQIWSSVVLFFRSKRMPLDRWPNFKAWLKLIQRCHNSSDITIRYQTFLAWNKLVFAVVPDSSTTPAMMSMLKIPITSGLNVRGADKHSQQVRHYALDSYHNLLHYALRPGLSNGEHDVAWDMFVDPMVMEMVKDTGKGCYNACRILHGLLNGNCGVWNGNVALQHIVIKPKELPKLDPRWVRARLGKILKLLEPIIVDGMWSSEAANAETDSIWRSLLQCVSDAGSQEIRTSNDLKQAIALIVNMLRRLWSDSRKRPNGAAANQGLQRYLALITTVVDSIGTGPFTEEILSRTDDNLFEVAPTPSHRHSKAQGTSKSPLVVLFDLFRCHTDLVSADTHYEDAAFSLLNLFTSAKSSFQTKLEICQRCLQGTSDNNDDVQPLPSKSIWTAVARVAVDAVKIGNVAPCKQESQSLGHGLRSAMEILITGLSVSINGTAEDTSRKLYDGTLEAAKTFGGDGAIVLAVMEPFAKALIQSEPHVSSNVRLRHAAHMLSKAVWPRNRQSMQQAQKTLWGLELAQHKTSLFEPFDHVYLMVSKFSADAYDTFDTLEPAGLSDMQSFFRSVIAFLDRSPSSLLGTALRKVQGGLVLWVEDTGRKTGEAESTANIVRNAWSSILQLMKKLPDKDSTLLKALESLLAAGFSSPHRAVVNETILFWNETFAKQSVLDYPPGLERVLRARIADVDIELPTFPESVEESVPASLPTFFDSLSQDEWCSTTPKWQPGTTLLGVSEPASRSPYFAIRRSMLSPNASASSPIRKTAVKSASSTPKPRLRHDDSQMQFAPIDSSPLPQADGSQLLTEHQKEIQVRQHEDARMFAGLSSSPTAHSPALPKAVFKRLNFNAVASSAAKLEAPATPKGLTEGNSLMSDDLPWSPTPSSAKEVMPAATVGDDVVQPEEHAIEDPPSSPPQADVEPEVDLPQVHASRDTTYAVEANTVSTSFELLQSKTAQDDVTGIPQAIPSDASILSDTELPTIQLQLEENAAASAQEDHVSSVSQHKESDELVQAHDLVINSDAEPLQSTEVAGDETQHDDSQSQVDIEVEVTRIENSFLGSNVGETEIDSQSTAGSQQGQRASKKRRRSKLIGYQAKRRKPSLPPQNSYISTTDQQDDDDDDIGEEIVVASSQRSPPPVVESSRRMTSSPSEFVDAPTEVVEEPRPTTNDEVETSQPTPVKRGRGRPRKSETSPTSPKKAAPTRTLKRKASVLSNVSTPDDQATTSFVKATPYPTKLRKTNDDGDSDVTDALRRSQPDRVRTPPNARKVTAVVVEGSRRSSLASKDGATIIEEHGNQHESTTPDRQVAANTTPRTTERPIATPRSILKRLKDAFADFKGMLLGSQEEREYDNVLFEFRREVHEAGRRGRGQ